jgi:hypothetical protein
MKTKRIETALFLYELLLTTKRAKRLFVISSLDISTATFKRVISDIRCYLIEFQPDRELVYSKLEDAYFLRKVRV